MPYQGEEKRKYIRLNSCFPVEFSLIFLDGRSTPPEGRQGVKKYQGFTHDVSKGGLCIRVRNLAKEDFDALSKKRAKIDICINMPLFTKPIYAICEVMWLEETRKDSSGTSYSIGASYEKIETAAKKRILNYARRLKWAPRVAVVVIAFLIFSLLASHFYQSRIRQQNKLLIGRLVEVSEKRNDIFEDLNNLNQTEIFLEKNISQGKGKIKELENEISKATELKSEEEKLKLAELQNALKALQQENTDLKSKVATIAQDEALLERQLASIEIQSSPLEQANIQKMRDWISTHRNRRTGLVISYEGDKDYQDWAFTYDEALAAQAFLLFADIEKATSILDFYKDKAKRQNGLFCNAYDAQTGGPVEYIVSSGPNIWIAISATKLAKCTNNASYLKLAEDIADIMISMQRRSDDGGIKGGPDVEWVSTEHNMDAYALFGMLYELGKEKKYKQAQGTTLSWLKESAYNKPQGRFNRGKGDSTIATDTFSWAIASIGPAALKENGMDPDAIMEFAEEECMVKAQFYRPDDRSVEVIGFDFAKAAHLGRGGVVSCEWTAQMVVAFRIMADYHKSQGDIKKASLYYKKAQYYLTQLNKMVISSPSPSGQGEGCLPYASIDNVDTGHGWRVAKGRRTGSVAATIYYIFANRSYNPLST